MVRLDGMGLAVGRRAVLRLGPAGESVRRTDSLAGEEPLEIRYKVAQGNAARVLLDAAAGADLLVVGSRGHGGFAEALLGSIGQHAVHHATCPVVVIRDSVTGQQHG